MLEGVSGVTKYPGALGYFKLKGPNQLGLQRPKTENN